MNQMSPIPGPLTISTKHCMSCLGLLAVWLTAFPPNPHSMHALDFVAFPQAGQCMFLLQHITWNQYIVWNHQA